MADSLFLHRPVSSMMADFNFPAKYGYFRSEYQTASKVSRSVSEIQQSISAQESTSGASRVAIGSSKAPALFKPGFLDLPLEIRLHIYSYMVLNNKARHAHLSPVIDQSPATSSAFFLRALSSTLALSYPGYEPAGKTIPASFTTPSVTTGSHFRGNGCGHVPQAMLRTCKQVYEESKMIPWQENEFVFINWFCSGVYAARSFLRSLRPWQRDGMRWARVEVLGRDLKDSWVATMVGGRAGGGEWVDLCGLWSGSAIPDSEERTGGLWGLRLGIKGRVGAIMLGPAGQVDGSALSQADANTLNIESGSTTEFPRREDSVLDVTAEWVTKGLGRMRALRELEIEIEDKDLSRHEKVQFCIDLGKNLSEKSEHKVRVVFVEKVEREAMENKQEEPVETRSSDVIWGVDM